MGEYAGQHWSWEVVATDKDVSVDFLLFPVWPRVLGGGCDVTEHADMVSIQEHPARGIHRTGHPDGGWYYVIIHGEAKKFNNKHEAILY